MSFLFEMMIFFSSSGVSNQNMVIISKQCFSVSYSRFFLNTFFPQDIKLQDFLPYAYSLDEVIPWSSNTIESGHYSFNFINLAFNFFQFFFELRDSFEVFMDGFPFLIFVLLCWSCKFIFWLMFFPSYIHDRESNISLVVSLEDT